MPGLLEEVSLGAPSHERRGSQVIWTSGSHLGRNHLARAPPADPSVQRPSHLGLESKKVLLWGSHISECCWLGRPSGVAQAGIKPPLECSGKYPPVMPQLCPTTLLMTNIQQVPGDNSFPLLCPQVGIPGQIPLSSSLSAAPVVHSLTLSLYRSFLSRSEDHSLCPRSNTISLAPWRKERRGGGIWSDRCLLFSFFPDAEGSSKELSSGIQIQDKSLNMPALSVQRTSGDQVHPPLLSRCPAWNQPYPQATTCRAAGSELQPPIFLGTTSPLPWPSGGHGGRRGDS